MANGRVRGFSTNSEAANSFWHLSFHEKACQAVSDVADHFSPQNPFTSRFHPHSTVGLAVGLV
ncbi:MAG: hypothetical protein PHX57_11700, partial [Desulfobulbaceae bacterium]|nr:hypothetical protein [Desulfobulbaceae bacterium]